MPLEILFIILQMAAPFSMCAWIPHEWMGTHYPRDKDGKKKNTDFVFDNVHHFLKNIPEEARRSRSSTRTVISAATSNIMRMVHDGKIPKEQISGIISQLGTINGLHGLGDCLLTGYRNPGFRMLHNSRWIMFADPEVLNAWSKDDDVKKRNKMYHRVTQSNCVSLMPSWMLERCTDFITGLAIFDCSILHIPRITKLSNYFDIVVKVIKAKGSSDPLTYAQTGSQPLIDVPAFFDFAIKNAVSVSILKEFPYCAQDGWKKSYAKELPPFLKCVRETEIEIVTDNIMWLMNQGLIDNIVARQIFFPTQSHQEARVP